MKRLLMTVVLGLTLAFSGTAMAQSLAGSSADANQAQTQGQGQSQSTSSVSAGGQGGQSYLGIQNSFNGAKPIRYLPLPSVVPMENYQGTIFGRPDYADKGPNFVSMRQMIAAMNLADLDSDVRLKSLRINVQSMGKVQKPTKTVVFELNDGKVVNDGFKPIAVITVAMKKDKEINSASLAMAIGKRARALGAGRCVFLTEGSTKKLTSGGWGIGLSYNMAKVGSDGNDQGSVGAGGTGYSRGWAMNKDMIYLTAIIGN